MHEYPMNKQREICKAAPMPELELAQSYVKDQPYMGMVSLKEGFKRGSMFPDLFKPYQNYKKC